MGVWLSFGWPWFCGGKSCCVELKLNWLSILVGVLTRNRSLPPTFFLHRIVPETKNEIRIFLRPGDTQPCLYMTYFWSLWQFYHDKKFKIYPRHIRKPENVLYFSLIFYLSCMWNQGLMRSDKYSLFTGLYAIITSSVVRKIEISDYNIFNARIYSHFK